MLYKNGLLNWMFLLGISFFHVYVVFHRSSSIVASASAAPSSQGCPIKMAKGFFRSAFLNPNAMFVARTPGTTKLYPSRTNLNLVELKRGEDIHAYLRGEEHASHSALFATAEARSTGPNAGTTPTAPALSMSMSVPLTEEISTEPLKSKKLKKKSPAESLEVIVLGLSHHNAKVEVRERLAIPEHAWNDAAAELCEYESISEAGVLSTCNRFELYLSGKNQYECMRDAIDYLHKRAGGALDLPTLRRSLFLLSGEDAIWHLLRVSAGLDSLIVGEGQILAQVKRAYERGVEPTGHAGRVVARMLNTAVSAGKRVRTETEISKGAVSVSSAAAEFTIDRLQEDCGISDLTRARVTIVGAGKMARLLLDHLGAMGLTAVTVVNLDLESIEQLASEYPDLTITGRLMADLYPTMADSDVVYTCTGSQVTLLEPEPLRQALAQRDSYAAPEGSTGTAPAEQISLISSREVTNLSPNDAFSRSLSVILCVGNVMFVDISVPRNVHADCAAVASALCYNVDHLKAVVQRNTNKRRREMLEAEGILREEQSKFRVSVFSSCV